MSFTVSSTFARRLRPAAAAIVGCVMLSSHLLASPPLSLARVRCAAVVAPDQLVFFDASSPATITSSVTLSGFHAMGEQIDSLFQDPANGQLYGYGSLYNVYSIDAASGLLQYKGALTKTGTDTRWVTKIDPVTGIWNVLGTADANLEIDSGTLAIDTVGFAWTYLLGDPSYLQSTQFSGFAFDHSHPSASATTRYAIDFGQDTLVSLDAVHGWASTIGDLTYDSGDFVGLACGLDGYLYSSDFDFTTDTHVYRIDPSTGAATLLGTLGGGNMVARDMICYLDFASGDVDGDGYSSAMETAAGTSDYDAVAHPFSSLLTTPVPVNASNMVKKLKIKLRFDSASADTISVSGKLPSDAFSALAGTEMYVDVGGYFTAFTLNGLGQGVGTDGSTILVKLHPGTSKATFKLDVPPTSAAVTLLDDGLVNSTVSHQTLSIPIAVWLETGVYTDDQNVRYDAIANVKGTAKH